MQKITLYRFNRPNGGVTVSPVKPDVSYTELFRLIAEDGCTLTNGVDHVEIVDTDNPDTWEEELAETEQKARAYDILMGVKE